MLVQQITLTSSALSPACSALLLRSLPCATNNALSTQSRLKHLNSLRNATAISKTPNRSFWWRRSITRFSSGEPDEVTKRCADARQRKAQYYQEVSKRRRGWDHRHHPSGGDHLWASSIDASAKSQATLERLRRMQAARQYVEDNPFEAVFGRSARLAAYPGSLSDWTRNILTKWMSAKTARMANLSQHLYSCQTGAEMKSHATQASVKGTTETQRSHVENQNDLSQRPAIEYEIDPITLRKVPVNKDEKLQAKFQKGEPALKPKQGLGMPKDEKEVVIPLKTYSEPTVTHKSETSQMANLESARNGSSTRSSSPSTGTAEDSWDSVEAGIKKRRQQYNGLLRKTSKPAWSEEQSPPSKSAAKPSDRSWLFREGFGPTEVNGAQSELKGQESNEIDHQQNPRNRNASNLSKAVNLNNEEPEAKSSRDVADRLQLASERLRKRSNAPQMPQDVSKSSPEISNQYGLPQQAEGLRDFQEQKLKDLAFSREIREIYEDSYGKIDEKHQQVIGNSQERHSTQYLQSTDSSNNLPTGSPTSSFLSVEIDQKKQEDMHTHHEKASSLLEPTSEALRQKATTTPLHRQETNTIIYRVLAYDPRTHKISSATTTSSDKSRVDSAKEERILSIPEILMTINSPSRFLPLFRPLQKEGYELVRGSGNIVIFKKVRDDASRPITQNSDSFDSIVAAENDANSISSARSQSRKTTETFPVRQEEVFSGSFRHPQKPKEVKESENENVEEKRPINYRARLRQTFWGLFWVGVGSWISWFYAARF